MMSLKRGTSTQIFRLLTFDRYVPPSEPSLSKLAGTQRTKKQHRPRGPTGHALRSPLSTGPAIQTPSWTSKLQYLPPKQPNTFLVIADDPFQPGRDAKLFCGYPGLLHSVERCYGRSRQGRDAGLQRG